MFTKMSSEESTNAIIVALAPEVQEVLKQCTVDCQAKVDAFLDGIKKENDKQAAKAHDVIERQKGEVRQAVLDSYKGIDKTIKQGFQNARDAVSWHHIHVNRSVMRIQESVDKKIKDSQLQLTMALMDLQVEMPRQSESFQSEYPEDASDVLHDDEDEDALERSAMRGRQQTKNTADLELIDRAPSTLDRGRVKHRKSSLSTRKVSGEYLAESPDRARSRSSKGTHAKPKSLLKIVKERLLTKDEDKSQTRSKSTSSRSISCRKSTKKRARPTSWSSKFSKASKEPKRKRGSAGEDASRTSSIRDLLHRQRKSAEPNGGNSGSSASTESTAGADARRGRSSAWGESGYDNGAILSDDAKKYLEMTEGLDNGKATGRHEYNKD